MLPPPFKARRPFGGQVIKETFAVRRHEGVEVDHTADPGGDAVCNACDHHPSVAVTYEDYVAQLFGLDNRYDVPMCRSRSISGRARCERAPSPVSVMG